MDARRSRRVSEALREELAEIVSFEMTDPRLEGAAVTAVNVSSDGRYAEVKIGVRGGQTEQRQAQAALTHAAAFLRRQVAARLPLRRVPELRFSVGPWEDTEARVELLLRRAQKLRSRTAPEDAS